MNGRGLIGRRVVHRNHEYTINAVIGDVLVIASNSAIIWMVKRSAVRFIRGDYRSKGRA